MYWYLQEITTAIAIAWLLLTRGILVSTPLVPKCGDGVRPVFISFKFIHSRQIDLTWLIRIAPLVIGFAMV